MDERELRLECLRLAIQCVPLNEHPLGSGQVAPADADEVLARARAFADFLLRDAGREATDV